MRYWALTGGTLSQHILSELSSERFFRGLFLFQRQRLIQNSKNQFDGEAGPGSTNNSLKRTGSCSLENGGRGPSVGDVESGDKPGNEACHPEEEDDEDGIFSPVRIPGDKDLQ